ncbi:nucleotidyltransferase domain-containing protein [Lederbergia sp. NSJ-179]|uniref:nucleotidyltransferase family protein n=1 Tax=Lederbergia sp. NSJ-179 TaxID=2931402 RepID=UPI001FD61434|nr:nucleotidyltransferase domain-containing protein [Lederbergia sp. NSJ-179]MCJ7840032.1 nucleotidyltransferase domain-containing protein [Lederbergia sp. NSJ-179]
MNPLMISQRIKDQLCTIGKKINTINKIILFGSRAIGNHKEKSDIDLAFIAPNMTKEEWTKLTFTIEEELDTLLFLDLIKFEDAPDELKKEIEEYGKVIYFRSK